ncbi:OmpA family protein [Qipengyuania spongiae]|uniref:OmpA family protein n=1 Tax=Qipengyuania spongiae TaxID=2909673 RepID=A0ABY5T3E3_9SPHN|nr:OmpA family protein [Qipengyuania spongiae]UVI40089.1 OmpA family protein [Qipengyuania spongiae]
MRTEFLAIGLLGLGLAGCDGREQAPAPRATPSETPTSIIREGFEEPVNEAIPLSPLDMRIGFPDGGEDLSETATADLETLMKSPQVREGGPIILRSHTDAGGSDEVNLRASRARGEVVRDWLVERGIAEERVQLIVFGEQNPIEPNALPDGTPNEAGRAINRRVEIHVGVEAPRDPSLAEEIEGETEADTEAADALDGPAGGPDSRQTS